MTRTTLHELAMMTAKASIKETNPIALSEINVQAAKTNKIAPEDFQTFEQYVQQARITQLQLARQPLPSETAAARAAQAAKAPATDKPPQT